MIVSYTVIIALVIAAGVITGHATKRDKDKDTEK
jgi:hypothetical protein